MKNNPGGAVFRKKWLLVPLLATLAPAGHAQTYTYQLSDGFESGVLGSPWSIEMMPDDGPNVTVQPNPARAGNYAVHLVNNFGDGATAESAYGKSNQRTEMTAGAPGTLHWGKEYWIGFSFFLMNWQPSIYAEIVHQIHAVPNGGVFSVLAGRDLTNVTISNDVMSFETITFPRACAAPGGAGAPVVWTAPVQSDAWYDWVLHVRPSEGTDGFTEIWSNGRLIYQQQGPNVDPEDAAGMASDPTHYLKCGVYNYPWETGQHDAVTRREIVYDQVKIGCVDDGYAGGYAGISPQGLSPLSDPRSAPSTLSAVWNASGQVQLSWFDVCGNGAQFLVERRAGEGAPYVQIGTAAAGTASYLDFTAAANTTYVYRVRASNGASVSPYSLEATARREDFSSGAADFAAQQGTWTTVSGTYHVAANVGSSTLAGLSLLDTPVAGNFVLSAACTVASTGSSFDNFIIVFGYQDAADYYYAAGCETVTGSWSGLYKVVGGVTTKLTGFPGTFPPGTAAAMTVQRVGQSILVYANGTLLASVCDTTFPAGKVGFGTALSGARQASFANVTLTQSDVDSVQQDFSGGAGDFTVAQGTWSSTDGLYAVTGNGVNVRAAALALLPERDNDDVTIIADGTITNTGGSWDNLNLVLNYQDLNDYYFVDFNERSNGLWNGIFRMQGGTVTPLTVWSTTLTPGTTYSLKVEKTDGVFRAYANNVLLGTVTDSAFTGGQIGIGVSNTTSTGANRASFDNIAVFRSPDAP